MTMMVCQKVRRLLWLGILISLLSCAEENDAQKVRGWSWGRLGVPGFGPFAGYYLGCSLLGEIEAAPDEVQFSFGYHVTSLPQRVKHYGEREEDIIDDGPLEDFSFTGVVLTALATQKQRDADSPEPGEVGTVFISDLLRVAKTAAEIERPEEVFFENISLAVDTPECPEEIEECRRNVNPSFILCWDNAETGRRAYQLIRPAFLLKQDWPGVASDCGTFFDPRDRFELTKGLSVRWPILDQYVQDHDISHNGRMGLTEYPLIDSIDEVLPRPRPFPKGY